MNKFKELSHEDRTAFVVEAEAFNKFPVQPGEYFEMGNQLGYVSQCTSKTVHYILMKKTKEMPTGYMVKTLDKKQVKPFMCVTKSFSMFGFARLLCSLT